jgi:hypothetical protein
MEKENLEILIDNCSFPDTCEHTECIETHISWVVLTDHFAFKIKRPVKFSFLDYSTIEKREELCHKELKLNRRLAPDIYEKVVKINHPDSSEKVFAVQMKKLDQEKKMDRELERDAVTPGQIEKLAGVLAEFHRGALIVHSNYNPKKQKNDFNDILEITSQVAGMIGDDWKHEIEKCCEASDQFLFEYETLLEERIEKGYIRDGHGDLNARNVFLYDEPVIFDCIEFNDALRRIDVLNDIAFLTVDLEFFGTKDYSNLFFRKYVERYGMKTSGDLTKLYNYYKCYRANIRTKVTVLNGVQNEHGLNDAMINDIKRYITLMGEYRRNFK